VALWPDFARLFERIKKDKRFNALNLRPPPGAFDNGKVIAILGKQGTCTHKGKHEINFESSSFKSMLMKRDIIDQLFLEGDVAPRQVPPIAVSHATHYNGVMTRTESEISATMNAPGVPLLPLPNETSVTPTLTPFPTMNYEATIDDTSVLETILTLRPYLPSLSRSVVHILTRVSTNKSDDCPESESDSDEDINRGTSAYSDLLIDSIWESQEGDETYCPWKKC
jgi:hypothetical protein